MTVCEYPRAWESRDSLARFLDLLVERHLPYPFLGQTAACFDQDAARLEGTARLLWGAAFALSGGVAPSGMDRLLADLAAGCDPDSPAYWGPLSDVDQRAVEMAAIAATLLENPGVAERLGAAGAANLYRWLSGIQSVDMPPNNWRFFRIFVLKALAAAGQPFDEALLVQELDFIDSQYRGGGWYGDHRAACRDYYTAFAFHFYSLLYARWFMAAEPERCAAYVERAREFALRYRYWFDDEGGQIAYGRSLTYRFAVACFWPLMACFGHPELSIGMLRGLWARSMQWWLEIPARVFDPLGRITIGFGYAGLLMAEFYNSPQSPLWALKSLFPLALGAEAPFWQAVPEACPYPSDVFADRVGGFVMSRRQGGAYMLAGAPCSAELRGCMDKYMKFAYSSRHGFSVESTAWIRDGFVGDNILAFSLHDRWFGRERLLDSVVVDSALVTRWSPLPGCHVETRQEFDSGGEARRHIVDLDVPLEFVASGHAVDAFARQGIVSASGPLTGETLHSGISDADGVHSVCAAPCMPNTNLLFPQSAVPLLRGRLPRGRSFLNTVLRYGRGRP